MLLRISVFLVTSILYCQQNPAPTTEPASLEGRTVAGGQPVRKASVMLRPMEAKPGEQAQPYGTTSDAEGKFRFESVEPGRYLLMVERSGYLRQAYRAKAGEFNGTLISVRSGQQIKDLTIEMTQQATITGKVVDGEGDPVGRSQVALYRWTYRDGKRRPQATPGGGMSDENGEFKISGVAPGRYYLCSSRPFRSMGVIRNADPKKANAPEEDFAATCYPNATDFTSAVAIDVAAGQNLPAIEIRLRKGPVFRVKGKLVGEVPGHPLNLVQLQLSVTDATGPGMMAGGGSSVDKDGNFELPRVHPGSYKVTAMIFQGMPQVFGATTFTVGTENLSDVVLPITPPADLKGHIRKEGAENPAPPADGKGEAAKTANYIVSMFPENGIVYSDPNVTPDKEGNFTVKDLSPGRYQISVSGLADGTYLKSVRLGAQEMPPDGIDLSSGIAGELNVIVATGAGQIEGTISNEEGKAAGGSVTLVPEPAAPGYRHLYRIISPDQNGHFTFENLPPGKYRISGWEEIEPGAFMDPEFTKPFEGKSVVVTLNENGHESVDLKRITAADVDEVKRKSGR